jgi:glycosyltransferase involved in cell wall biosynthesis
MLDRDLKPFVTIGIPFYKDALYLRYAIQSVINQTYTNWELILMDDGSADGSLDIAKSFSDPRVRVVSDGANKGLPARLNEIVTLANGDYVARMDADDIMAIDRIEKQVSYLQSHPEIDVIGCSAMVIDDKNCITHSVNQEGITGGFIHPTIMTRTQWFKDNPYDERQRRCQDYELWLRTSGNSVFYNMPDPLLFYREFETLSLMKQLAAHNALMPVFSNYRKYGKSFLWNLKKKSSSYIKLAIYYSFDLLGIMEVLNKWRWHRELPSKFLLSEDDLQRSIYNIC